MLFQINLWRIILLSDSSLAPSLSTYMSLSYSPSYIVFDCRPLLTFCLRSRPRSPFLYHVISSITVFLVLSFTHALLVLYIALSRPPQIHPTQSYPSCPKYSPFLLHSFTCPSPIPLHFLLITLVFTIQVVRWWSMELVCHVQSVYPHNLVPNSQYLNLHFTLLMHHEQ